MVQLIWDDFTWERPVSRKRGFTWEGAGHDAHLVRIAGATFTSYRPHSGIFRDFACLEPTPAAVLNFVNRYGTLQHRVGWDSFPYWHQGIRQMRQLVALSDAVTDGDLRSVREALEPFLADAILASAAHIRPLRQKLRRGEQLSPSEQAEAAVICLYQAIGPLERYRVEGSWNSWTKKVEVRLKPADLLGFLYLQLGHAFVDGRRFKQCPVCGKSLLLLPGVNRKDRITCSGYCRLKRSRQRASVLVLSESGWIPARIAKKTGLDISEVKAWISQATR